MGAPKGWKKFNKINMYVIDKDITKIKILKENGEYIGETMVDTEDVSKLMKRKWVIDGYGYITSTDSINSRVRLNRFILDAQRGEYVDHINHGITDNRKCNLRKCTNAQNGRNRKLSCNNKSGVSGVYWSEEKQRWKSQIHVNYKKIHLGNFVNKEDAIKARLKAEDDYFGDFSYRRSLEISSLQ